MKKKVVALFAAAMVATLSFAACGDSSSTDEATNDTAVTEDADEAEADDADDAEEEDTADAGFTENEIFSDEELGFINLSAVWFQAVPMDDSNGTTYTPADGEIHIEADISALKNDLGYGVGDWIPYLTIDYSIVTTGTEDVVAEGTFMPMAASDGPHYGNNIDLPVGEYDITFTIHSPGEKGYLIHSDSETGPGGLLADYFADGNLTYTYTGWQFDGLEN